MNKPAEDSAQEQHRPYVERDQSGEIPRQAVSDCRADDQQRSKPCASVVLHRPSRHALAFIR